MKPPDALETISTIYVFSNFGPLALNFIKDLLENNFDVKVFTEDVDEWNNAGKSFVDKLEVFDTKKTPLQDAGYIVDFCLSDIPLKDFKKNVVRVFLLAKKKNQKVIYLLPFRQYNKDQRQSYFFLKKLVRKAPFLASILFIGEVIGGNIFLSQEETTNRLAKQIFLSRKKFVTSFKDCINPASTEKYSKAIIKNLFSFGNYGEEAAILGHPVSLWEFAREVLKNKPGSQFIEKYPREEISSPLVKKKTFLTEEIGEIVKKTIDTFSRGNAYFAHAKKDKKVSISDFSNNEISKALSVKKPASSLAFLGILFVSVGTYIISPFIIAVISFGLIHLATVEFGKGKFMWANKLIYYSQGISIISNSQLSLMSELPYFGKIISPVKSYSEILRRGSLVYQRAFGVQEKMSDLAVNILNNKTYDPSYYSENIYLDLEFLSNEIGFLQGEIEETRGLARKSIDRILPRERLKSFKTEAIFAGEFSKELTDLLGKEKKKTYLLLFQDNFELRPAGGHIEAFALITLNKGKLTDIKVSDVYEADALLKGSIDPPFAIKKYLNESVWYLRDSNWDADFSVSAQRAEWLLEKELGRSVDGVISFNTSFVKKILEITGGVNLIGFNQSVNSENLFSFLENLDPGGKTVGLRQKGSEFSSLFSSLLNKLSGFSKEETSKFVNSLYEGLAGRELQVFLHNQKAQSAVSNLNWGGGLAKKYCLDNCYSDWAGVVEANLGLNKANLFIERKIYFSSNFAKEFAERELVLEFKNTYAKEEKEKFIYKVYTTALIPKDSFAVSTEVQSENGELNRDKEIIDREGHKEVGIWTEVIPGKTVKITFKWEGKTGLDFRKKGEYQLTLRKQSGIDDSPIFVNVSLPEDIKYSSYPETFLTQGRLASYNASMARDFVSRIYW